MLIDNIKEALRLVALDMKNLKTTDSDLLQQMHDLNQAFESLAVSAGVVAVDYNGSTIVPAVRTINFAGDAVDSVTNSNGEVTVNISKPTRYTHNQNVPSDTWVIVHNMNCYPSIVVVDSSESIVQGEYRYDSPNQMTAIFSGGFSGQAFLS